MPPWLWAMHPTHAWIPAQPAPGGVEGDAAKKAEMVTMVTEATEVFAHPAAIPLLEVHPSSLQGGLDNMVDLEELTEGAMLHNLRGRYLDQKIYTNISSIVLSINPYMRLPNLYGPHVIESFREELAKPRAEQHLPPHVYGVAAHALHALKSDKYQQAVIISGESGAGKTEATKLVLEYLAECSEGADGIEQQILQTNPIIEAFGNAKTVRNNNSSRFGKWIEVMFDEKDCSIFGSRIYNYLLEKSRVTVQARGERNYHIFYFMLAGATVSEKEYLGLTVAKDYKILSGGQCFSAPGISDAREMKSVRNCFDVLNFSREEQEGVLQTLAALLHLGNIVFEGGDTATTESVAALSKACALLGADEARLRGALLTRSITVMRERIEKAMTQDEAHETCGALSAHLYDSLFSWIIEKINLTLDHSAKDQPYLFIGVLDIFGFEVFQVNFFEQLCINYANERLQQFFDAQVFSMEQEEYREDGLPEMDVSFVDNQLCLDVIDKNRTGILAMIVEEMRLPKGSDNNLLDRMHATHKEAEHYAAPRTRKPIFSILHYAGQVTYEVTGFLDKNKDSVSTDIGEFLRDCGNSVVRACVSPKPGPDVKSDTAVAPMADANGFAKKEKKEKTTHSLGLRFRGQLQSLLKTLHTTKPHFIRCIKPNSDKDPKAFNSTLVLRQLQYLGLLEVVKVRKAGYPVRLMHAAFVERYRDLVPAAAQDNTDTAEECVRLLQQQGAHGHDYAIGNKKVFLRAELHCRLEDEREIKQAELVERAVAVIRGMLARRRAGKLRVAFSQLNLTVNQATLLLARSVCPSTDTMNTLITDLEDAVAVAVDLELRPALSLQAKQYVRKVQNLRASLRALTAAISAKDIELLERAVQRVAEGGLPAMLVQSETHTHACTLLFALKQYEVDIEAAIRDESVPQLMAALDNATELGRAGDKEKEAEQLLAQLQAVKRMEDKLIEAAVSRHVQKLQEAIKEAQDMDLALDNGPYQRALLTTTDVEAELAWEASVRAAMIDRDQDKLTALIGGAGEQVQPEWREEVRSLVHEMSMTVADIEKEALKAAQEQERLEGIQRALHSCTTALSSNNIGLLTFTFTKVSAYADSLKDADTGEIRNKLREVQAQRDKLAQEHTALEGLAVAVAAAVAVATEGEMGLATAEQGLSLALDACNELALQKRPEVVHASTVLQSLIRVREEAARRTAKAAEVRRAAEEKKRSVEEEALRIQQENDKCTAQKEQLRTEMAAELSVAVESKDEELLKKVLTKAKAKEIGLENDDSGRLALRRASAMLKDLVVERQQIEQHLEQERRAERKKRKRDRRRRRKERQKRMEASIVCGQCAVAVADVANFDLLSSVCAGCGSDDWVFSDEKTKDSDVKDKADNKRSGKNDNKTLDERREERKNKRAKNKKGGGKRAGETEEERKERRRKRKEKAGRVKKHGSVAHGEEIKVLVEGPYIIKNALKDVSEERESVEFVVVQNSKDLGQACLLCKKKFEVGAVLCGYCGCAESVGIQPPSLVSALAKSAGTAKGSKGGLLSPTKSKDRRVSFFGRDQVQEEPQERKRSPSRSSISDNEDEDSEEGEKLQKLRGFPAYRYSLHLFAGLRSADQFAKGSFNKNQTKARMLRWTKVLPRSLTTLDDPATEKKAINLFKDIQGFMGDRYYRNADTMAIDVLQLGVREPGLRDEVYLQLLKQLADNSGLDSEDSGWRLLCFVCATFPPSDLLEPHLIHHLLALATEIPLAGAGGVGYTEYAAERVKETISLFQGKPSDFAPPLPSLEDIENFKLPDELQAKRHVLLNNLPARHPSRSFFRR